MIKNNKEKIYLFIPTVFVILLWLIKLSEVLFDFRLVKLGIYPRQLYGLPGILLSPLVHSDFSHLTSNTLPLIFLATGLFYLYKTSSTKVVLIIYLFSNILVWIFARPAYHIGASGLIYGFASFLFFSGIIRRESRSIALSLLVIFLYGGMVWGILPLDYYVSWEAHLFGGLTGLICAIIFRKKDVVKKYDWEDEPDDEMPEKLKISYKKGYPYN